MSANNNDRTPLLGSEDDGTTTFRRRERGDLGFGRHVVQNKMTWDLYTLVVTTGSVAQMLFSLPYNTKGMWILGSILYFLSLILLLLTILGHLARFLLSPRTLLDSLTHPAESSAVCTFPAALAITLINAATFTRHSPPHHHKALAVFYWAYIALTVVFTLLTPLAQFSRLARDRAHGVSKDPAASLLTPLLPLVLAGPASAALLAHLSATPGHQHIATRLLTAATIFHGLGTVLLFLSLAVLLAQLTSSGLPAPVHTPSLFAAALAPAFASWGATSLAAQALRHFPAAHTAPDGAVEIVGGVAMYYIGLTLGLVLWALSTWWGVLAIFGSVGAMREVRGVGYRSWGVVAAHAGWVLASAELLAVMGGGRAGSLLVEVVAMVTLVVWAVLAVVGAVGVGSGRLLRD